MTIFERNYRGRLRLTSVDDWVGPRPGYTVSGWGRGFYELWIYAHCPKPTRWYRDDEYSLVAAEILDRFYSWRGHDVLWGVTRKQD